MKKAFRRDRVPSQKASPALVFYQGRAMGLVRANGEDNEMSAPMAELRAAQAGDVGAVVAIDPHGPGRPSEIEALVREQASLVAVEHGEILGFLAIRPGHFYQRDFIDLLLVAPRSRRQGIGRALMRAALQNASTPRMFVSTNQSNMPMRELLRSEGWSASGVLTGLDENDPEHVFFHDAPAGQPASGHERAW